jgi:hypothetical protein
MANAEYTLTATSGGGETSRSVKVPVTSSQHGVSQLQVFNCNVDRHTVYLWMRDVTAGTQWSQVGSIPAQYDGSGTCPGAGASAFAVPASGTFKSGHLYAIEAVDTQQLSCDGHNDPQEAGCIRWNNLAPIVGDANGSSLTEEIT